MAFGNDVGARPARQPVRGLRASSGLFVGTLRPTPTPDRRYPLVGNASRRWCSSAFQAMFAIITVALISGAVADRMKFGAWLLFAALWATIVYFPVAHWVFAFDGTSTPTRSAAGSPTTSRAIDFAGGTAVHINAGAAGARAGHRPRQAPRLAARAHAPAQPAVRACSAPACCGSAGSGSTPARRSAPTASPASPSSTRWSPPAAAMLGWLIVGADPRRQAHQPRCRLRRRGRPGRDHPGVFLGLPAGRDRARRHRRRGLRAGRGPEVPLRLRRLARRGRRAPRRWSGRHPADRLPRPTRAARPASAGLFYGGGVDQLWRQAVGAFAVLVYSFVAHATIIAPDRQGDHGPAGRPTRTRPTGIDETEHAETAYDFSTLRSISGAGHARARTRRRRAAADARPGPREQGGLSR